MEYEGCGETIGHGEVCSKGWLCEPCRNKYESANEIERLRKENDRQRYDIMLLNSRLQTEHEIIRIAALKESE